MSWSLDSKSAFLIATLCLGTSGIVALEEFVSGAVPLREPENHYPILYSSVVPVTYKFQLPTWDPITTKIQFWSKHNNCTESDRYEDGYPCPILYHMNYLVEYFTNNMTSWKNLMGEKPENGTSFLQDPSLLWDASICSNFRVEPHFKGLQARATELEKYIQALSKCTEQTGKALNIKLVNLTSVAEYLEDRYHFTFMSFTSDYWQKLGSAQQEAVALVSWSALQAALMTHQYMESQKIVEAVQTCRNQRIPWTLIDKASLKQLLLSLKNDYLQESYDYAIPLQDISKYFSLPLTDCIFGDDNSLIVTIMLPLLPKEAGFKNYFVKYRPVPFTAQGKVCALWNGEDSAPFNVGLNGILPCHCSKSDLLCKAWGSEVCSSAQRLQETCLQALASDLEQEIVDSCQMKCKNANTETSSEQRRLDIMLERNETDTVKIVPGILTEDANRATFLKCAENKNMPIPLQTVGAYKLSIPRNCNIITRNSYAMPSSNTTVPNIERVKVTHLMPYHWRKGITIGTSSADVDDEGSFLDTVEKLEGVGPKINFIASKVTSLEKESERGVGDVFLWLFVLLSLLMNVSLAVAVHQLYMWKRDQVYKANRLVYNITPDEDIHHFPSSGDQQTQPLCNADAL